MRLTKWQRSAFINSVMNELPKVDYKELTTNMLLDAAVRRMPREIAAAWAKAENRAWFELQAHYMFGHYFYLPAPDRSATDNGTSLLAVMTEDEKRQASEWEKANAAQSETRETLRQSLSSALSGISTVKQLRETFPDFAKHAPQIEARAGSAGGGALAVRGIVEAFAAAGYPL